MKTKVREKANWPVTILLILGLITVVFPLYMTIVIAFKQPTEMTNSVAGILSLPQKFSLANFREAMEVTDFWHSLGNSVLITVITVVLAIVIHSLLSPLSAFFGCAYDENFVDRDGKYPDRKSTRLNSSHVALSRMPSSA